jgi:hypothetical protein
MVPPGANRTRSAFMYLRVELFSPRIFIPVVMSYATALVPYVVPDLFCLLITNIGMFKSSESSRIRLLASLR